jgi:hypothetical protein
VDTRALRRREAYAEREIWMVEKMKYFAKGLWVDRHLAQWITTIMIIVHTGLSMAIVAGGEKRFSRPSYGPLIEYTHGHVWIWGIWIFVSAMLMGMPFRWPNMIGLWLGMSWHISWMSCFMIAALRYETAAATPIPVYGGFAMICAALLTARVIDKSKE